MKAQPAKISYFFDKGYRDIKNAIGHSWKAMLGPGKVAAKKIAKSFSKHFFLFAIFLSLFDFIVFTFMTIIGTVTCMAISIVLLVTFIVMMIVIYVLYMIAKLLDFIFCVIQRMYNKCPKCQKKFMHPIYICKKCGAKHDRLIPSKYGILKRRCNCDNKIPTTFFNGRQKLPAICPHCDANDTTSVESNSRDICCIPVIGGRRAGKTCFITSSILGLQKHFTAKGEWKFEMLYGINDEYVDNIERHNEGICPDQTSDMQMKYYRFAVYKDKGIKNIISLCDVAGEAFSTSTAVRNITEQIGLRYADGLLMVVDPLSIRAYREALPESLALSGYRGSTKEIDEVLSVVVSTLENMLRLSYKDKIKKNIAVVFTKCDIPGLDELIGDKAVQGVMNSNTRLSVEEARNHVCIEFLKQYDEQNFVNSLMSRFENVQFFLSSALGHNENGEAFVPKGVEEPVMWLLSKCKSPVTLE